MLEVADKQITSDVTHTLTSNLYFGNELRMMLEAAGFRVEAMLGAWNDAAATADDDVIVLSLESSWKRMRYAEPIIGSACGASLPDVARSAEG